MEMKGKILRLWNKSMYPNVMMNSDIAKRHLYLLRDDNIPGNSNGQLLKLKIETVTLYLMNNETHSTTV